MAHLQYVDELVREYLLFRGFSSTLKTFDAELKADKDKGFRVDKLVEQLTQHIYSYDLVALKELWAHLDHKIFSRLEQEFTPAVRKLENAVLKLYVVNTVVNGKTDKLNEFFSRLAPELQGQGEWKDWFLIPFLKNPEESPTFAVHFTRQWQDTLLVSLHNFLATIFQVMPLPTLASLDQDAARVKRLQEENESLRHKLAALIELPNASTVLSSLNNSGSQNAGPSGVTIGISSASVPQGLCVQDILPPEVPQPLDLMDDFYVIAPEGTGPQPSSSDSQVKTLKSLIRNIGGLPSSPIMGRKPASAASQSLLPHSSSGKSKIVSSMSTESQHKRSSSKQRIAPGRNSPNVGMEALSGSVRPSLNILGTSATNRSVAANASQPHRGRTRDLSSEGNKAEAVKVEGHKVEGNTTSRQPATPPAGGFLILSQEHYLEHKAATSHCHFNTSGTMVASADVDGIIKVWDAAQTLKTVASFNTKSRLLALDWISKNERYFMSANSNGIVRLLDTQDSRILWEMNGDSNSNLKGLRLQNIACSPIEPAFLCSATPPQGQGRLLLFDIKTKQLQRSLNLVGSLNITANCFAFNHNGQLVAVGCSDGSVQVFDIRRGSFIDSWPAHSGPALALQLTPDDTACYTAGSDDKLCGRSMTQSGQVLCESLIPELASLVQLPNNASLQPSQLFAFHQSGAHVLVRCAGGSVVCQVGSQMERVLELSSPRSPTVGIDWASANQCSTCLNAHANGSITVSTLLTP
ncbi:WD repeat-containing protein 91 [Frankliniella fusca]|uniref:WD repeat-containing protein 91 n=1 Tax=Frankliniella fusca TaxID=407009 RepID=A0AAE1I219_9NEOP|nr:WD repeat-containing protein 91 [Frankliniella fusca]